MLYFIEVNVLTLPVKQVKTLLMYLTPNKKRVEEGDATKVKFNLLSSRIEIITSCIEEFTKAINSLEGTNGLKVDGVTFKPMLYYSSIVEKGKINEDAWDWGSGVSKVFKIEFEITKVK